MEDIIFLYDQVLENIARLNNFAAVRGSGLKTHPDIRDDIDSLTEHLARRDLLVLAASMRNFAETAKATKLVRSTNIVTSEIFISAGPPFVRDAKKSISLYQCLSRVLHAHDLRIFRTASDYYRVIATSANDYLNRILSFRRQGGNSDNCEEPLIGMITEREKLTLVRLQYLLAAVCNVLGELSEDFSKKKIFLQRDYR